MIRFSDLNLSKPLLNALDDAGLVFPTTIQQQAFPVVMSGRDVVGIAQTGTGKTFAYLLPLLRLWTFSKKRTPQIAIIVPTRELVAQVLENIELLTKYQSVVAVGVYGGANIRTQAAEISNGLDIIVGTPGRFMDLALNGDLVLRDIKKLVIDEVDELFDLGFRTQLLALLDLLPERKQSLMFSATMSEDVQDLIDTYFQQPARVEAAPAGSPLSNITEKMLPVANFHTKINWLIHVLSTGEITGKTLIFIDSKRHADLLFDALIEAGVADIGVIHSNKAQNQRFQTVSDFKSGLLQILIATDLISRGIDVEGVQLVICADVPANPDNYIHRIGRTGRADARGEALTLVSPFEANAWDEIVQVTKSEKESLPRPEEVPVSSELINEEQPQVYMKIPEVKLPSRDSSGSAFHDKKDKNKKVNVRKNWKKIKMDKYGKPKTRGQKKK